MLIRAGLPRFLWTEAVNHKVYLKNRTSHSSLPGKTTPHERATKLKPNLSNLREFGALVWVKVKVPKLTARAEKVHF
ncbi:hypothetical protein F5877DRAFT_16797, partial [Lentinula edodes]